MATERRGGAPPRVRSTLSREAWLLVGQELLRTGGFTTVKLAALTQAAGVTTGSFYHHFADMDDYLTTLAEYYGGAQITEAMRLVDDAEPLERLRRIAHLFVTRHRARLDAAMRTWASFKPEAKRAVRQSDRRALEFLERAFDDMGFHAADSKMRARMLLSFGVAPIFAPWRRADGGIEEILEILCHEAPLTGFDE